MDYYLTRVSSTELSEKIFKTECSIKNNARFSIENMFYCVSLDILPVTNISMYSMIRYCSL